MQAICWGATWARRAGEVEGRQSTSPAMQQRGHAGLHVPVVSLPWARVESSKMSWHRLSCGSGEREGCDG